MITSKLLFKLWKVKRWNTSQQQFQEEINIGFIFYEGILYKSNEFIYILKSINLYKYDINLSNY